jgi:hypothetical protein
MLSAADDGFVFIQLLVVVVFGGICATIAAGRGRSPVGWFFIGVFTQCVGLILVLVLPNMKVQEEREKRQHRETRKLREQLQKERQVSDQRHNHVERRLGAHDESLGLDTSTPPGLPNSDAAPQLGNAHQWFYARDNERQGPVSEETIRHLLTAKAIDRDSLVWRDGMPDWTPAGDLEQFRGDVL